MRVSFDFDGTLTLPEAQQYCKELLDRGIEVFVTTFRYDELRKHLWTENPCNKDLWEIIDNLGIDRRHVIFTNMTPKSNVLKFSDVLWHLDDMFDVLFDLKENTRTEPVFVLDTNWKERCNQLLKEHDFNNDNLCMEEN